MRETQRFSSIVLIERVLPFYFCRMTQDYLVCSQMCEPFLRRGTFFFVWDLPSLMIRQAAKGVKFREWIKPDYVFKVERQVAAPILAT